MDDSIMIVDEVTKNNFIFKSNAPNTSDLEILYDAGSSECAPKKELCKPLKRKSTPRLSVGFRTNSKPIRQRKPILKQQVNDNNSDLDSPKPRMKKRLSKSPRRPKMRPLLRQKIDEGSAQAQKAQSFLKSGAVRGKGIKRSAPQEIKPKVPRTEVGGAGTSKGKKKYVDNDIEIVFEWDPASVISERQGVDLWQAKNIIGLFDQENTLPFIARYRKEKTGNMDVEKLREIQNSYSQLKHVQEKVVKVLKSEPSKVLPLEHKQALVRATTVHEVEHLTSSLKGASKRSFAERAKELGLAPPAKALLEGGGSNLFAHRGELFSLVNHDKEGLRTVDDVELGLRHIIADVISKHLDVLDHVRQLMRTCRPLLEATKKRQPVKKTVSANTKTGPSQQIIAKYENYFNFKNIAWNCRSHQILAINRGETQNVLSVKVAIPDHAYIQFFNFCQNKWIRNADKNHFRTHLIISSIEDGWERLVKPFIQRQIRSQLTETAEIASVEVFTSNLKKLLLTPPVRGKTVLAIDPGFLNGCKIGVTNAQGENLLVTTIYPFKRDKIDSSEHWSKDHNARTLREIVDKYGCELIAVGNGTACRQMEQYLSMLISSGCFSPYIVKYAIINESGASQYSVTPEAAKEYPGMDPNHISAISLARRLQDPLLEYVKVSPMHLGVGMYQHDISERLLNASLDSVMIECVSFVGVDINVASEFVLRKLSGLNKTRSANIVEYRQKNGPIMNREQLKEVKGIGPKTFEQCAGFIRIMPDSLDEVLERTPGAKKSKEFSICPLDRTLIHPESYKIAYALMKMACVRTQNIGSEDFLRAIRKFSLNNSLADLAPKCDSTIETMQVIVEGLSQPLDFDIRAQFEKPLFREGITSMDDLKRGTKCTGTVRNVTHFGAFVDIGVGTDGLIHTSNMNGMRLELGSMVETTVEQLDKERKRIGLNLERVL